MRASTIINHIFIVVVGKRSMQVFMRVYRMRVYVCI